MKGLSTNWTQNLFKGILSLTCFVFAGTAFGSGVRVEDGNNRNAAVFNRANDFGAPAWFAGGGDLPPCTSQPTEIGGTVFRDYNANGTKGSSEPGFSGVVVNAYDDDDAPTAPTATTTTTADGTYLLTGLTASTNYRLEFVWSNPLFKPGASGGTAVQVATAGSCNINMGVNSPAEYCQDNPKIVLNCYLEGPNVANSGDVLISMNFNAPVGPVSHESIGSQIGTTYGLAQQRSSNTLFAGAFMKRFAGFGSGGPGAIYKITSPTDGATSGSCLSI